LTGGQADRRTGGPRALFAALARVVRSRLLSACSPVRLSALLAVAVWPSGPLATQERPGKAVYDRWCAGCHGDTGAGDGEAASTMLPRPRDFTRGIYQIRTTASGQSPTDADLHGVIADGMPGTAMPGWKDRLTQQERDDVVAYIKSFSRFFEEQAPEPLAVGSAPGSSEEGLAEGRQVFEKLECFKCHGTAGRGDGTSAPTLTDDWDHPIRAADLTESWLFTGGTTVEQIYARLRTGLDGTPMPSFSDVIESKVITEEQLWRVAQYVRSLSPEEPPAIREVIRAGLTADALPSGPGDSLWAGVERYYVPLVGQIIQNPRWFIPTVDGVWVQALHDGQRLALRLSWHDPSQSPGPAWDEWLGRIRQTAGDSTIAAGQGPDRMTIQFPFRTADEGELPYFLSGDRRRPVALWRWTSNPDSLVEGTSTGLGRFTPWNRRETTHAARFADGEWQLQLTRTLPPADTSGGPRFIPGRSVPIGFFVADGSNGEDQSRGSVSAWYAIYLDVPTPQRVYIQPVVAVLLTAVLGLLVVNRAQRRERAAGSTPEEQ
jgi:DMSO reductase family type II enzyme heme b subunit